MATKLCQIVAVEKGSKKKAHEAMTEAYHKLQKQALLTGISRTYRPKDEGGEQLPSESTRVQTTAKQLLTDATAALADLFDVTATRDYANCDARADVTVGDVVLVKNAPVPFLLFLEKKLVDIHTIVSKLPVLDPSEKWSFDNNSNCYASEPAETRSTKKVFVPLVLAPATDKHPAQVKEGFEDQTVGYWKTVKFSGAVPAQDQAQMLDRIERLQRAVKYAREECNAKEITQVQCGQKVMDFILGR